MPRWARWTAWILGGVTVALASLVAALHTAPVRRFVLRQVVGVLQSQNIDFEASRLDYNLLAGRVTLAGVVVRSPVSPDLPPLLQADEVMADLALTQLIRGAYRIESAAIRNPRMHLAVDEQGRDNLPRLPPGEESQAETDYLVHALAVTGGGVRVEDRRQRIEVEIPLGRIEMTGDPATGNHDIRLETPGGGRVSFEGRTLPLRELATDLQLERDAVEVRRLAIGLGESAVTLAGRISHFDDARFDLRADTTLAVASLVEFAGVEQRARGTVNIALAANGPLSALVARASVTSRDLAVERFERLALTAEAVWDAAASRARLHSLTLESPAGTIRADADVALNTGAGESSGTVSARSLDLARVASALDLPVRIASRADAGVRARWPGLDFESVTAAANVRLTGEVAGSLDLSVRDKGITAVIPELRARNATASGRVAMDGRRALSGELRAHAGDIAAVAESPVQGAVDVTAKLAGTAEQPAVSATVSAPALRAGTLDGIAFHAEAGFTPGRLTIQEAAVRWRDQFLTASGTVGLAGPSPALDLTARSENVSVEAILAGLDRSDINARGTVDLTASVGGTAAQPQADVNLAATGLEAFGEVLGKLAGRAQLRSGLLEGGFQLDKPQAEGDGRLKASGGYNPETREYAFQLESDGLRLTSLALRGEIGLAARGQGRTDDPALELDFTGRNLEYEGKPLGAVEMAARVAGGKADITAAAPRFGFSAEAGVGTAAPYPATIEAAVRQLDIASLPVELDAPLTGTLTATIRGSGDLNSYEAGRAEAEISGLDLTWRGQPIRTEGALVARYGDRTVTLDPATIVAGESRLRFGGTLPLEEAAGEGLVNLSAKLDLAGLAPYVPSEEPISAKGVATIDGAVRGNLRRIDPDLTISLEGGEFSVPGLDAPISKATLRGEVRGGALELGAASASFGPATFSAKGAIPFALLPGGLPLELPRRQGPARLTAELQRLDLAGIEGLPEGMQGTVSARLEAEAVRPNLESVNATLTFPDLRVGLKAYALEQKGPSTFVIEKGTARVGSFLLTGPSTEIRLVGAAGLTGDQPLDLKLDATLDASIAAAFAEGLESRGPAEVHVAVKGTVKQPLAQGYLELTDGQLGLRQPRIGIDGLNARIDLAGNRATLSRLEGAINGGALSGQGAVAYADGQLRESNLSVKADGMYLDFPEGLRTVSNIDLQLKGAAEGAALTGEVLVLEGGMTDDLILDRGILAMSGSEPAELDEERNPFLEKLRFFIGVRTDSPIAIDNNLAKAEVTADLRILGNPYEPGLSGRLIIEEGGELRLQERRYLVERGIITFTNERRIEPSLDIVATTTANQYDVRLEVSGEPGDTETRLTSDPSLPEPEILALLLTGKTMEEMRGEEFAVASNQMLSYLTGRVGSSVGRGIAGATGLSTVRIEPNLIAAEADPSARLTVGQDITRNLELIYSMDLIDSSDQIYVAEYDLTRRFTSRGVRQADGSYRFDFRHDLRFGGISEPRRQARPERRRIGHIKILGDTYFGESKIAEKLDVKPGGAYDFFKIRRGLDRVNRMYTRENMLEAGVRLTREPANGAIDLTLNVTPGPKVNFVFEGISVPGGVRDGVRDAWLGGVFDAQRTDDAVRILREWLVKESHLRAKIESSISSPQEGYKRVLFDIDPGPRFRDVEIVFDGAQAIKPSELRAAAGGGRLATDVHIRPASVTEALGHFYRQQGYLDAKIETPRYELEPEAATGKVIVPVSEGPLFRIGEVIFEGNKVFSSARLADAVPLPKGQGYRPVLRDNAIDRLKQLYWEQGYNDMEAELALRRSTEEGTVDVTFRIAENGRGVVRDVVVEGNRNTSESLIRTQLALQPGDALDLQKVGVSRRNLYNTGAYSMVEIVREPLEDVASTAELPVRLRVRVREIQPFEFRYGGFFDTERGPGAIADFSNRNTLGSARVLGLRTRFDSQLRELRFHFSQPLLQRFPLRTIVSPYLRYERNPATEDTDPYNVDRVGISLQQEATLRDSYVLNYGYRIERSRTYDPVPDPLFDVPLRIASLTSALTRETRDEILDATRGSFMSHALQFSPASLGSELRLFKYFGQYFRYFALEKPRIDLFTNEVRRPRLVYAGGVRVGLSTGLGGQEVPLSERFFAGGATTIRGFEQNSLGPSLGRQPLGGEAMLVLNNELRFPVIGMFDGVGFVDIGNVYRRVSDFSLADLRKAAGAGLRVRTPWFLLRFDYGLKLDRRSGESRGALFFSIGQAF